VFSFRKQTEPFHKVFMQAQCIHSSIISVATLHNLRRLVLECVTVPLD